MYIYVYIYIYIYIQHIQRKMVSEPTDEGKMPKLR